jgi:hypothetical protein
MPNQTQEDEKSKKWSKADKINGVGVSVAIFGLIAGVLIPFCWHIYTYSQRPQASITRPIKNSKMASNKFGTYGTAAHIPADSDLWLIVRSDGDGRWYPTELLQVANGTWHVSDTSICPAPGFQELVVYMIPDSAESPLFSYINSNAGKRGLGINSVPVGSVVMASAIVNVAKNKYVYC